ncbi:energy-coupling factor transporter transmembrane protein EcfT [Anaerobacillus sp. CMMVII]|uniref:energy-coupling factor transporter transmembrane component T family protein n=1 Tax=Anaerobacillus sp. CMMVII TaxID=2755588 RepID=UPI0021B76CAB|nr:energy-coupling factor transporter transmembrane component T [Anaerobacillus sp. CMMVII]MCT8137850.1 energy-coupling factor transporter transmembrane protein EcfT [Anaerobacillus sp. CMMVII]
MITSINPSMKAFTVLIPAILLAVSYDPITPLVYLVFTILVTFLFSNVSIKRWSKMFFPFILIALSFSWMTILYPSDTFSGGEVLFSFWRFEITSTSLMAGISLGLRSLSFVALSLLFVLTTDSTKFMLSLMQQCKLPPKFTYGILAGYRFLPTFRHEFQILKQAHRIRGVGRARGLKGRIQEFQRFSIPLFANAIRKAERVAIAMESKGFTGSKERTHYHEMKVTKRDWLFLSVFFTMVFVSAFISYQLGMLNLLGYQF